MELKRRNLLVYGFLMGVWALVAAWQFQEHLKVKESARTDLRKSSKAIANTVGAFIRGLKFRGAVFPDRLEPALNELVNASTNELVKSSEVVWIALLNAAGEQLASAGPVDLAPKEILQEGERWGARGVTMIFPVEGATVSQEGNTNQRPTFVAPNFRDMTNANPEAFRGRGGHRDSRPDGPEPGPGPDPGREPRPEGPEPAPGIRPDGPPPADTNLSAANPADGRPREGRNRPRRPFGLDEEAYQTLIKKRELHGLAIAMSTDSFRAVCRQDLWLRGIIAFFAAVSAAGVGWAWRNLSKSAELQIRLVRASEMNTHLREMNLAAAGLAHETRNPLNIIRGLAQIISRQTDAPGEIRTKSREIVDETDKVTAQLNEFINYSRPRELRRSALALNTIMNEVVHALNFDIEEKQIQVEVRGDPLAIEADEQLLRQVLFNLALNAVQALPAGGRIEILALRQGASEAAIEIRDNGPGVPPERRAEIFKPYFTTQLKGTGLGLAIVQQIVLAHGWEIECRSNEPQGAVFRITHIKAVAKR